jgi:hypothetical protein
MSIRDLAGEGARGLRVASLRSDLDLLPKDLLQRQQVKSGGRDHHLCNIPSVFDCAKRDGDMHSPTDESISASLRILTIARLASTEVGFILKLPPTKNLRAIVMESYEV